MWKKCYLTWCPKSLSATSILASSNVLVFCSSNCFPLSFCNVDSTRTPWHTFFSRLVVMLFSLLWHSVMRPPSLHVREFLMLKLFPHTQISDVWGNGHLYLYYMLYYYESGCTRTELRYLLVEFFIFNLIFLVSFLTACFSNFLMSYDIVG